ncbi:hypothetical protein GGI42DRAFT_231331 [Trichoderma sp. SZMC 28013]
MEPSVSRRVRWMMRASFVFFFLLFFLFHIVWFISRANPPFALATPGVCCFNTSKAGRDLLPMWGDGRASFHVHGVYTTTAAYAHDLDFFCFCLSVERSQGIVLLEMSSICLPFRLLGIHITGRGEGKGALYY